MKISPRNKKEFICNIKELLTQKKLLEMNQYIQHGNTTTLTHCLVVSYYSYFIALGLPFKLDKRSIIRGAMLHDFYLYDWHVPDDSHKLHGFKHSRFALLNSRKYFKLNSIEKDIIDKHMWPLTLTKFPLYKESLLVCLVDKFCSLAETFYIPLMPKELKQFKRRLGT